MAERTTLSVGMSTSPTMWAHDDVMSTVDPNTELGLFVDLWHAECDRAASLESELDRWRTIADRLYETLGRSAQATLSVEGQAAVAAYHEADRG